MPRSLLTSVLLLLVTTSVVSAQYPISAVGLNWTGTFPTNIACWDASCIPIATNIVRGETGSLTIRGDLNQTYWIGFSFGANRCLGIPSAYNMLVLDDPITIVFSGTLTNPSPILACPPATASIPLTIPPSWPLGASFSLQALVTVPSTGGTSNLSSSFTRPITFTIL